MVYTHRPGLYADMCACVAAQNLRVLRSDVAHAGHLRCYRFWVVDAATSRKLEHAALTPVSISVRDAVVQPGLWPRWHSEDAAARAAALHADPRGGRASLRARARDRPGLLRDVALALLAREVDVDQLRARRVSGGEFEIEASVLGGDERDQERSLASASRAAADVAARGAAESGGAPRGLLEMARADLSAHAASAGSNPGVDAANARARMDSPAGYGGNVMGRRAGPFGGLQRAESIADLNRFQIGGAAAAGPSTPNPATTPPPFAHGGAPDSPLPLARAGDPHRAVFASGGSGLHRAHSVANFDPAAGAGANAGAGAGTGAGAHGANHGAGDADRRGPETRGKAIAHSASVADFAAMRAAGGAGQLSRLASTNSARSTTTTTTAAAEDAMHVDSPGVSVASATLRATDAVPGKHPSLFREGGFPALPSPRRDRSASDYHLLRELGRGLCGTVYLGRERDTGRIVAFKVMRKTKLVDVGEANHASEERRLHERISDGPFINRLLASFQDPWALFLILEYAPCGDLFQAMNFHGLPTRGDAVTYAVQVATALEHLHGLGYVYRDLKPENILLHPHGSVQLADFGMAKRLDRNQRTYTICGTAQYMSPEVLLHRGCQFEADLWAMGIFVYELVTGDTPFSSISGSRQELYRRLMSHDPEQMAMPPAVDRKTASLVRALLRNAEHERLGAGGRWHELYAHAWFAGVDVRAVQRGDVTPQLSPRRRNVVTDPALQKALERGDVPWRRGAVIEDPATLAVFERF